MAITDPTIDPVTGLPILDTSGIVQQIPLGRQIVDYTGWNATAQPTRGPIFPDDGTPVFANVQGQHPTTGNAQNVTTDGQGRLNVHTFPSGGGGGLTPENVGWIGQADMVNVGSGTNFMVLSNVTSAQTITGLTGYALHIDANPQTQAADGTWYIYIYAVDIGGNPIGVERPVYRHRSNAFTNVDYPWRTSYHVEFEFSQPWNVSAMWPNWHEIRLEATIQAFPAYATGWFFWY